MSGVIESRISTLSILKQQRSHLLFTLSNSISGHEQPFVAWYVTSFRDTVASVPAVVSFRQYEQHEIDITVGEFPLLPFKYLSLAELSVDGAVAAKSIIERISSLHREQPAAQAPATWLYYPASEKVGRSPPTVPSMLTLAFANPVAGHECEFREWYATRHIRHALNIPALVSGQYFERTQFQLPGSTEALYSAIAVYEQDGSPEEIIQSISSLPASTFEFPTLDLSRFAETVFRPL